MAFPAIAEILFPESRLVIMATSAIFILVGEVLFGVNRANVIAAAAPQDSVAIIAIQPLPRAVCGMRKGAAIGHRAG